MCTYMDAYGYMHYCVSAESDVLIKDNIQYVINMTWSYPCFTVPASRTKPENRGINDRRH